MVLRNEQLILLLISEIAFTKKNVLFLMIQKNKKMDLQTTKLDIVQKLMDVTEESLLGKIETLLDKEMIVAYTTSGKPLTKKDYNLRLQNAENQISEGNFLSQEELEELSKNW